MSKRPDVPVVVTFARRVCEVHGRLVCSPCNRAEIDAIGRWFWDGLMVRPGFTLQVKPVEGSADAE